MSPLADRAARVALAVIAALSFCRFRLARLSGLSFSLRYMFSSAPSTLVSRVREARRTRLLFSEPGSVSVRIELRRLMIYIQIKYVMIMIYSCNMYKYIYIVDRHT
jgi:hypothetical protein